MTQKDKDLLLKDICARLPHGVVICTFEGENEKLYSIRENGNKMLINDAYYIDEVKPYLFPLSSINEAQCYELIELFNINIEEDYIKFNEVTGITFFLQNGFDIELHLTKLLDWLNKNHFDYYDLISIGLAIDATNLNIY